MKTISTIVYEFEELSESAKERARDWYRQGALNYEWWESIYEDAKSVGLKIKGFDLDRNRYCAGGFTHDAEFCANMILESHGAACETHKTATQFKADLSNIPHDADTGECLDEDAREELESEFLKSILEDYSIMLQREYEWLMSDEQVDEAIIANEYTFTESGKRF